MRWAAVAMLLVAVLGRTNAWAALVAAGVSAGAAIAYGLAFALAIMSGQTNRWPYVVGAAIVLALSVFQFARRAMRRPFVDPVVLFSAQLGAALMLRWLYYIVSGAGLNPAGYLPATPVTPLQTEVPLLALALAGVGLGISRPWRPAASRLGIEIPRWWQVMLALAVADFLIALVPAFNILTYRFTPDSYFRIGEILYKTFTPLPGWAIVVYAVLAGICEESLFRGALQPRAGVVATAVLFAAIHIQYGFTPILGMVFLHGIAYGLLRRYLNLTTAIIAHAAYDSGGFPLSHRWESTALWAVVLAGFVLLDVWRRRSARAARQVDRAAV